MGIEERLKHLEEDEEALEEVSRALRKRSHNLFERAKEESGIKRFWYELKAQVIQYFAIRNTLKASGYSSKSWTIRKDLKNQIGENARILGYTARLERYEPNTT